MIIFDNNLTDKRTKMVILELKINNILVEVKYWISVSTHAISKSK